MYDLQLLKNLLLTLINLLSIISIYSTFTLKCVMANYLRHKIYLTACSPFYSRHHNHPTPLTVSPLLTSDNELALVLYSGSLVACDAGVVAVVHQCEVGDAKGAGKVYVVDGDTKAGWYWPTILLPGDEDGLVA